MGCYSMELNAIYSLSIREGIKRVTGVYNGDRLRKNVYLFDKAFFLTISTLFLDIMHPNDGQENLI